MAHDLLEGRLEQAQFVRLALGQVGERHPADLHVLLKKLTSCLVAVFGRSRRRGENVGSCRCRLHEPTPLITQKILAMSPETLKAIEADCPNERRQRRARLGEGAEDVEESCLAQG